MPINVAQIRNFAAQVDAVRNGGNGNGYVDGSEIELFKKKCRTQGLDNVDEIIEGYSKNKYEKEAEYQATGATKADSVDNAIISALTPETALRDNDKSVRTASTIAAGVKGQAGFWSNLFGNDDEIDGYAAMLTKENVLAVAGDADAIAAFDEGSDSAKTAVIANLVALAKERQIDVSNIVIEKDGKYVAGRDVPGDIFGQDAIESKGWFSSGDSNFQVVVSALKDAIDTGVGVANGSAGKTEMLTMIAKRIDADGNGNGYIDTAEETEALKQYAASKGIDVDAILEEIRDNEAKGIENTTADQKTIYNIFDPTQQAAYEKNLENQAKDIAKGLSVAAANDDEELAADAISKISSDNVMQLLDADPSIVDKLTDAFDFTWKFWRRDSYKDFTSPILTSLMQHAQEYGVEIDDLVAVSGDKLIVGSAVPGAQAGSDATDSDNVAKVIKAVKDRITTELT